MRVLKKYVLDHPRSLFYFSIREETSFIMFEDLSTRKRNNKEEYLCLFTGFYMITILKNTKQLMMSALEARGGDRRMHL
jgi:hypothetical protein